MGVKYATYIKSRAWRLKRLEVLRRCNGVCEKCGLWPATNVHHKSYEHLGDELPEELIGVCLDCHQSFHETSSHES